jgi:predicted alpha/beta hydrolase family esterase
LVGRIGLVASRNSSRFQMDERSPVLARVIATHPPLTCAETRYVTVQAEQVRQMTPILIVPGLGGSGQHHWQTYLERSFPGASRVHQDDWDRPDREAWTERLAAAVDAAPGAVLVAHSLGCAVVVHAAAARPDLPVAAALLVAPADVDRDREHDATDRLHGFAPMPCTALPFRSVVVASTDDPYLTVARARAFADDWGAEFIEAGALGHINVDAGFGPWSDGERMLRRLITIRSRTFLTPPSRDALAL